MAAFERIVVGDADKLYHDRRYYYDGDGNLVYFCGNTRAPAVEADTDYDVWKFTYDVNGYMTRKQGPLVGSCAGRTALGW